MNELKTGLFDWPYIQLQGHRLGALLLAALAAMTLSLLVAGQPNLAKAAEQEVQQIELQASEAQTNAGDSILAPAEDATDADGDASTTGAADDPSNTSPGSSHEPTAQESPATSPKTRAQTPHQGQEAPTADQSPATQVLTTQTKTYVISVTYGPDAGIPQGASLDVREIVPGSPEFEDYYSQASEALTDSGQAPDLGFARFFDVSIMVDNNEVEPLAPVEVKIVNKGSDQPEDTDSLQVIHFANDGVELIDPQVKESSAATTVIYEQDGFSVIGLVTNVTDTGWPTSAGQYVVVLQDGSTYYALGLDGHLTKVRYFGDTISFMGEGTTSLDYLDDYAWNLVPQGGSASRWAITSDYFAGTGAAPEGVTFVDFFNESCFSTGTARYLTIRDGKVNTRGRDPETGEYVPYTFSAQDGVVSRVGLYDPAASPVMFVSIESFEPDDNETEYFDLVDVNAMIDLWKTRMTQDLEVAKTAEVYDYENRIYQIDIESSSGYYDINPDLYLEFVLDSSRSMYFPATLDQVATYNGVAGLRTWIRNNGNKDETYYFITDQGNDSEGGAANVFAVYWNGSEWRFVDASYHDVPDHLREGDTGGIYGALEGNSATMTGYQGTTYGPSTLEGINSQGLSGVLYTSPQKVAGQPWNRLDYLRSSVIAAIDVLFAVNPNAKIGLTSFNAGVERTGPYTATDKDRLITAVNNISLLGGTNHALGLRNAYEAYSSISQNERDHKQSVVFVTDGAPRVRLANGANESANVSWQNTEQVANQIKALRDKFGNVTDLYTLGLSLQFVGNYNKRRLAGISSGEGFSYNAENGTEVVDCITQVIESVANKSNLKGKVTDTIDQVFYPVDAQGNVLQSGAWIKLDGSVTQEGATDAAGQVTYDESTGCWKVEWTNQTFTWPTTVSDDEVPGWHGRIYVKAKEDFLGGNGINTNVDASQVEIEKFYRRSGSSIIEVPIPSDDVNRIKQLETPYVNVDELAFTENSTEWTVYVGTSVDPLDELKKLWGAVKVQEVVEGEDDDHRRNDDMTYPLSPQSTDDDRDEVNKRNEYDLSDLVTLEDADWTTLIAGGTVTKDYSIYGHEGVGAIQVELEQSVVSGETGLDPSPHPTSVTGTPVERYTLKVTYLPADASVSNYHTGTYGTGRPGNDAGNIESTNEHVINVFAKRLKLRKIDERTLAPITVSSAQFDLYREDDENGETVTGLSPAHRYVEAATLTTSTSGDDAGWTNESADLPLGTYWLVETVAPEGYNPIDPVKIVIEAGADGAGTQPVLLAADGTSPAYEKPLGWNWVQTAALNVQGSSSLVPSEGSSGASNTPDSVSAVVRYDVKNLSGQALPTAGGPGMMMLYALGVVLLVGGAAVAASRSVAKR